MGRTGASAEHGCDAGGEGVFDLLGADEVDMGVDTAGGDDAAFTGDDFRGGSDDHGDAILNERIPGVADACDASVLDTDIGFDNSLNGIEDKRVGDDQVQALVVEGEG